MNALPNVGEGHYGLYPHKKKQGVYRFIRLAFETEVEVVEPDGNSYELDFFTFSDWLRLTLQIEEQHRLRIEDMLWNFRRIQYNSVDGSYSRFDEVPHVG